MSDRSPPPAPKQLSREEKLKLLDLLEERKRRVRTASKGYAPNTGQLVVHKSRKKVRLVTSGNGAGKTTLGVNEALWAAKGYNPILKEYIPVPRRVVVVLDKPDKVGDKWLPELRKWDVIEDKQLHKNGKPYYVLITFANGSEIKFMFHEQEEMTFESLEVDDVIFDEPPPRKIYIALLRGMRNKDMRARVLIIGTPLAAAWLRKEIHEPWSRGEAEDTECFRFETSINQANLPEGYIDWLSSKMTEKERAVRLRGEWFDLDGLALAHLFRREVHILPRDEYEWDMGLPCVVIIDPHPSKKHVAVILGADKEGPVYVKEMARKLVPRDFARALKEWYSGYRVVDIVCDNIGSGQSTGGEGFKSFIEVLNDEGVRARPTSYHEKVDEDWIARLQDVLKIPEEENNFGQKKPKLRILDGNPGIVGDIETVEWARHRNIEELKPTLAIESKDYLACLKYGLASGIAFHHKKDKVFYKNGENYGFKPKHKAVIRRAIHKKTTKRVDDDFSGW